MPASSPSAQKASPAPTSGRGAKRAKAKPKHVGHVETYLPVSGGAEIYAQGFFEPGADKKPIVLVDGLGCDGYVWKYLIADLKAEHPIVHFNYRGHGKSPVPPDLSTVDMDHVIADLDVVLRHFGIGDYILAGHSMGVQVALEAYRQTPRRIRKLMLLCGAPGRPIDTWHGADRPDLPAPLANVAMRTSFRALSGAFIRAQKLLQPGWAAFLRTDLAFQLAARYELTGKRIRPEDFKPYLKHLAHMDMRVFGHMARSLAEHDCTDMLHTVDVPTLIVAGGRDTFTPHWLSERMADAIADTQYLYLPDGSHTAPIEQPAWIGRALRRFLHG